MSPLWTTLLGLACCLQWSPTDATARERDDGPARLSTLNRLVRHFDFEEASRAPYQMPFHFYRFGTDEGGAAQGFPPFGSIRLANDAAFTGEWSFKFSLDGGSLAARVPTAVLPAMPRADYVVTTRVRTADLHHARAGIAAWLHDSRGRIIPESRAVSRLVRTDGEWTTLAVSVRNEYDDVSDLVLELHLLQPRQFAARTGAGGESKSHDRRPMLEDVAGFAWFDDVSVWHLPRLEMQTGEPANLFVSPQQPALTILVRDAANTDLAARLRILDLDDRIIHERTFASPMLPSPRRVELPIETCGWYRAVLEVIAAGEVAASQTLDFALLAPPGATVPQIDRRFAVGLPERWINHIDQLPELLRRMRAGAAVIPVWQRNTTARSARELYDASHAALHELVRNRIEIIFCLASLPDELALALDLGSDEVLAALGRDPATWRDFLHDLLINFGLEVRRWQLGTGDAGNDDAEKSWIPALGSNSPGRNLAHPEMVERAANVLGEFVPNPVLSVVTGADHEHPRQASALTVFVPHEIAPRSIPEYAATWAAGERNVWIEPLPEGEYTRRRRLIDLAFRTLNAWRADIDSITLDAPWQGGDLQPDPALVLWRQLTMHLAGRRFGGELALGHGPGRLRCWILQGVEPGNVGLVAWMEQAEDAPPQTFSLQFGAESLMVYDLFGNGHMVPLRGGEHSFEVGAAPIFIEGVNLELVQFRGGFALSPAFVPAEHRVHEHDLVLKNPWPIPVSGSLVLAESPEWRASPRTHAFTIRPRSEVRLPVEITFDRSVIAGPKRLEAEVTLGAESVFRFALTTDFEVGLTYLDSSATWRVVRNVETGHEDLVITQYITNKGEHPVSAETFLIAPPGANIAQQRRIVAGLEPGELAIRLFHIPEGARLLAGRSVRLGVTDRGGNARLNQLLHVPDFVGDVRTPATPRTPQSARDQAAAE